MKNWEKQLKKTANKALSGPILALILLVAGVALTVVAVSFAGGFLFGWGGAPRVTIERVDILVNPISDRGYITVDVRNSGGSRLTNCTVVVQDSNGDGVAELTNSFEINPGQVRTFSADGVERIRSGEIYVAIVTCQGPNQNQEISDRKTAIAHI